MRVVRWSRRNRSASSPGPLVRRSMESSIPSCRCSRDWLRMEMFRKTWLTPCATGPARRRPRRPPPARCRTTRDREISRMALAAGGGDRRDVDVLTAPEPVDHARQPFLGHLADAGVQPGQVAGDLPAEPAAAAGSTRGRRAARCRPPGRPRRLPVVAARLAEHRELACSVEPGLRAYQAIRTPPISPPMPGRSPGWAQNPSCPRSGLPSPGTAGRAAELARAV